MPPKLRQLNWELGLECKPMKKGYLLLCFISVLIGCSPLQDCFQGSGTPSVRDFEVAPFRILQVQQGVQVVLRQADVYAVRVEAGSNLLDQVSVKVEDETLYVQDLNSCNLGRSFRPPVVYVDTPTLEQLHSNTAFEIRSEGVLRFPLLEIYSVDLFNGAGTGDIVLHIENQQTVVETNNVANITLTGSCENFWLNIYFGSGRVDTRDFHAQNASLYHRGSNDVFFRAVNSLQVRLISTGNAYIFGQPEHITTEELYSGRIYWRD